MGAFQTGFGIGMQAWNNAEQAKERQDKMDQITIDTALHKPEPK